MRIKRFLRIFSAACVATLAAVIILPVTSVLAAAAITFVTPSVPPGGTVTVVGTGFSTTQHNITVDWYNQAGGGTVYAISDSAGAFTAAIVVPTSTFSGIYTVRASDGTSTISTGSFIVTAGLSLGASTGFVGDSVAVAGSGFAANTAVSFFWDGSTTPFASLTSNPLGAISGSITIPAAARGNHVISTSSLSVPSQTFSVGSKIVINPTSGGAGDVVSITGTGFAATNAIILSVDGTNLAGTTPSVITTNTTGGFSATFIMPVGARGSHTIQATDTGTATATFTMTQKIILAPTTGSPGDTVGITGTGFSAAQSLIFKIDGAALSTNVAVTTDQSGAFGVTPNPVVTFIIPGIAAGAHVISVTDQTGYTASANLTVTAKIAITPATGSVGTQITVTGNGFTPNAPVAITWDNVALSPAVNTTASAAGAISITFNAPASAKGTHVVKASDTSGNSDTENFVTAPKMTLSPVTGGYNDTITVTLTGFNASSTVTTTQIISGANTFPLTAAPATVQTDANGGATFTFKTLPVFFGNWTIQVSDAGGASATAALAVTSKLTLNATTGSAGDTITVTGTGFGVGKSITMTFGGVALATSPAAFNSDGNGSFACQFVVPPTVAGAIVINATDGTNTTTMNFTALASASVSKVTTQTDPGSVGMDYTISGSGFKASSPITVTFESTPVTVATVTSDAKGSFTATFKVPAATGGNHTIKATDGTTTKQFAFFMDSTAPAAPALLTPVEKFKPKQPVPFSWNVVSDTSGVTYTLQISQDPAFGTLILEKTGLTVATYKMTDAEKLKASGKTPYYWRVKATDLAGNVGPFSGANSFTIGFIWPSWIIHVWYGIGIVIALIFGLWFGRRMAYQAY